MKIITSLFLVLFPFLAIAHEGHAPQGSFLHSYEHGVWVLAVVLIGFIAVSIYRTKSRKKY